MGLKERNGQCLMPFLSLLYKDKVHIEYILQVKEEKTSYDLSNLELKCIQCKFMHEFRTTGLIFIRF